MKALKIDVTSKTVTTVEINDYKEIYQQIGNGCEIFCCPVEFEGLDTLYADDESLLYNNLQGCFILPNWSIPIVGNAIVLGANDEGESQDVKMSAEWLQSQITWGNKEVAEEYQSQQALISPTVIFF